MPARQSADRVLGLHRAPVKVAAVVFVGLLMLWSTGQTTLANDAGKRPWLDWVALASIAYGVIAQLVLVPRVLAPRALREADDPERGALVVASMRLAFAVTPFLTGFAVVAAGADQWVSTASLAVTALMLVTYVRAARDRS